MMNYFFFTILGMAIVTYFPRMLPVVVMSSRRLPDPLKMWLNEIPISILGSLLAINIVSYKDNVFLVDYNVLLASIPTLLVAVKTKSLIKTVIVGIVTMAFINLI